MLPPGGTRHTLQVLFNSPSSGAWAPARSRGDGRRSGQKPNVRAPDKSRRRPGCSGHPQDGQWREWLGKTEDE